MSYQRVIPRDLFNEGDLLNCLGRLWIKLDEYPVLKQRAEFHGPAYGSDPFYIDQDPSDGSINCTNVDLLLDGSETVILFRPLNARNKWPLWARFQDDDVRVFDEDGELTREFVDRITVKEAAS